MANLELKKIIDTLKIQLEETEKDLCDLQYYFVKKGDRMDDDDFEKLDILHSELQKKQLEIYSQIKNYVYLSKAA